MAEKIDLEKYESFDKISERLDSIVEAVRDKSVSLEHSLDLFEEAISLGSRAVEMVDTTALSEEEKARIDGHDESAEAGEQPSTEVASEAARADAAEVEAESDSASEGTSA